MKKVIRWAVAVSALAAAVMLVTGGPAGAASTASTGSSAPVAARAAAAGALGNYRISGDEDAIGCLTAHRCVAVGYGGGKAPGQVVTVVAGKQVRVAVARTASNLVAVSCPNRFGCWAIGPPRTGRRSWVLVKIGPTGSIAEVTSVRLPVGVTLTSISCTSRTACEVLGITSEAATGWDNWYLAAWNGSKLSHRTVVGTGEYLAQPGGVSCWQATCVAVGAWYCPGSACYEWTYGIMTTNGGKLEKAAFLSTAGTFSGVSCVSASTCYATTSNGIVTLDDGTVTATESEAVSGSIECDGTTCWDAGMANGAAAFVMITNGAPTGTPVPDPALTAASFPSIARRGSGFAAVGEAAVDGGPRVSEVVTN